MDEHPLTLGRALKCTVHVPNSTASSKWASPTGTNFGPCRQCLSDPTIGLWIDKHSFPEQLDLPPLGIHGHA
ncbi:MAG: hypothetical protein ABI373_01630, partial [Flavobacteriales bacterium]